jgi:uncharacterized membrane protein
MKVMLLAGRGRRVAIGTWVPLAVGALFIVLGNSMGKLRPTWFVGIRTPWTLSSAYSWNRTHRLGGWAFIGIGLMMMATCIVAQSCFVTLTVVFTAAVLIALVVYSYLTWKRDPDRVPPAGRLPA